LTFFFAGKYFNAVLKKSQVVEIIYFCLKNVLFIDFVGNKLEAGLTNSSWWIDQGTLTEGEGSVRLTSSLR
jgi:hypothetical protein